MQDERNDQCHARVRHVPIKIESRGRRQDNQDDNRNQSHNHQQSQYHNQQQHHHHHQRPNNHNHHDSYSSQTLPNTSSININYKPPTPQRQFRSPSPNPPGFNNDQNHHQQQSSRTNNDSSNNYEASTGGHNSNQEVPIEARNVKPDNSANQPAGQEGQQASPPETIPLPPPPSHNQSASGSNENNQQDQSRSSSSASQKRPGEDSQAPGEFKRQPEGSDAANAINSIRAEVFKLLNENINTFDGVSHQAKEYLKLDELLTRCLLKLDNIDSGGLAELRQQRKDVVALIDKCTDVLQKKVQLNRDMQELYSRFSQ